MIVSGVLGRTVLALGLGCALAGCVDDGYGGYGIGGMGPKQTGGALVGAAAGGLIGNQFGSGGGRAAATALGVLIGAYAGSSIGQSLDNMDRQYAAQATYGALQSGQPMQWQNPQSGRYGYVQPGPMYQSGYGDCRQYQHTVYIDGRPQSMNGTACRQPDGSWRATN